MKDLITKFLKSIPADEYLKYAYNQHSTTPVYYAGPVWGEEELLVAITSLIGGEWLVSGEQVAKFERKFSKSVGLKYSVMVNSGSSANLVMLAAAKKLFGWEDEDEIIVSVVGFPTTVAPILQNNLKPTFIDIEMESLNFDLAKIEEKITNKTKAIFLSPVLGNPVDMDIINDLCDKYNIMLFLDGCDSLGSEWNGVSLFKHSVAATCSFYPAHHITTGEGGMVSSSNKELLEIARSIAWWGRACYCVGSCNLLKDGICGKRFSSWLENYDGVVDHKYIFTHIGYNLKPMDFQGAIGLVQIEKAKEFTKRRRKNKKIIESFLSEYVQGITIPGELSRATTSWFGVPVICTTKKLKQKLVSFLESNEIQTRHYFAGNLLLHPAYESLGNFEDYPEANKVLDRVFFLGTSPAYTEKTFAYIERILKLWI